MIRGIGFLVSGLRNFTIQGYERHAKHFDPEDCSRDLTGEHHIVTGANQGIGFETAKALASRGATVHLVCRDPTRGQKAVDDIKAQTGKEQVVLHICDVSIAADVQKLAHEYNAAKFPCHVLVHNAGCMVHERSLTSEGLEKNFATNVYGPWLMTQLLAPALKLAGRARVIFVSSGGMYMEPLDLDIQNEKLEKWDGEKVYSRNKRIQVAMAERFNLVYASDNIRFVSMHPGWAETEAVRTAIPDFHKKMEGKWRTPFQGADTVIWLASAPDSKIKSGEFYLDREVVRKHMPLGGTSYNEKDVDELWEALKVVQAKLQVMSNDH